MNPKISIIIPVFNAAEYLRECIESIIAQAFQDFEVILIDDGSTDSSNDIANELAKEDSRVFLFSKKNGGPSSARNAGLHYSKGDFISFVDADDLIDPFMLEKMYRQAVSKEADIISSGYLELNETNEKIRSSVTPFFNALFYEGKDIKLNLERTLQEQKVMGYACVWNKLFKRSFLTENNLWFNEKISIGEDLCFNLHALHKAKKIAAINEPLYYYRRINTQSVMSNLGEKLSLQLEGREEILKTLKRIGINEKVYKEWEAFENHQTVAQYLNIVVELVKSNNTIKGKWTPIVKKLHEASFINALNSYSSNNFNTKAKISIFFIKRLLEAEKFFVKN